MIGSKGRDDPASDLTSVQLKVLDRMRRGKTIRDIALELGLPQKTIKLYVRQGLRHLRPCNRETLLSLVRWPH